MTPDALATSLLERMRPDRRLLVAIAGPPGAGKSTLAETLRRALDAAAGPGQAAVTPMDGFHLDNRLLEARGLLARKGAPESFDAAGFVALIARIRAEEPGVVYPLFDRGRDLAVAGAGALDDRARIVLIEGNYLLADAAPWRDAHAAYDVTVALRPTMATLRSRLIQRWLDHGLAPDAAEKRALSNDIPNAEWTLARSIAAEFTL